MFRSLAQRETRIRGFHTLRAVATESQTLREELLFALVQETADTLFRGRLIVEFGPPYGMHAVRHVLVRVGIPRIEPDDSRAAFRWDGQHAHISCRGRSCAVARKWMMGIAFPSVPADEPFVASDLAFDRDCTEITTKRILVDEPDLREGLMPFVSQLLVCMFRIAYIMTRLNNTSPTEAEIIVIPPHVNTIRISHRGVPLLNLIGPFPSARYDADARFSRLAICFCSRVHLQVLQRLSEEWQHRAQEIQPVAHIRRMSYPDDGTSITLSFSTYGCVMAICDFIHSIIQHFVTDDMPDVGAKRAREQSQSEYPK